MKRSVRTQSFRFLINVLFVLWTVPTKHPTCLRLIAGRFSQNEYFVVVYKPVFLDFDECAAYPYVCGAVGGECVNLVNHGFNCSCNSSYQLIYNPAEGKMHCEEIPVDDPIDVRTLECPTNHATSG